MRWRRLIPGFLVVLPVIGCSIFFFSLLTEAWFNLSTVTTRTAIVAHRGLHDVYPENSMESVIAAAEAGFDEIEVDVHQTLDSVLVLHHDFTVIHPTLGEVMIADLEWSDLSAIEIAEGIHIPNLQSVLESVPEKVRMILELKAGNSVYPGIEEHLIRLIERYDSRSQIAVHSFNDEVLLNLNDLDSSLELHKLLVAYLPSLHLMIDEGIHFKPLSEYDFVQGLSINYLFANLEFIEDAHHRGQKVRVWNLAPGQLAWNLSAMGVDGIITDRPLAMKDLFGRSAEK